MWRFPKRGWIFNANQWMVSSGAATRTSDKPPTDIRALVHLLMYLEKKFTILPQEMVGRSLAFDLLRTMRLSLRKIARTASAGCGSDEPTTPIGLGRLSSYRGRLASCRAAFLLGN